MLRPSCTLFFRQTFANILLLTAYIVLVYLAFIKEEIAFIESQFYAKNEHLPEKEELKCVIPQIDPFNPELWKLLKPWQDRFANCKKVEHRSKLFENRTVIVANITNNEKCWYRCIEMPDDVELQFSNWTLMELYNNMNFVAEPKCDVFELKCEIEDKTTYKYIYFQIHENPPNNNTKIPQSPTDRPDVHMILLDSVSMSHALRALPQTLYYLRN